MNVTVAQGVRALDISAVVTRCGCTPAQKASPHWHAARGEVCPRPMQVEDLGTIVRWHRNPLRRAWYAVRRLLLGKV